MAEDSSTRMTALTFWRRYRGRTILLLLAGIFSVCYFAVGTAGYHWVMLQVATRQYEPNGDGSFHSVEQTAQSARFHRDALVRSGQLLHRNYQFTEISCPTVEADWLQTQFLSVHSTHAEPVFSTTGRSSRGDNYAINVWFQPDELLYWDNWYAKHNDLDYVRSKTK